MTLPGLRIAQLAAVFSMLVVGRVAGVCAAEPPPPVVFNISPQPLGDALRSFARQSGASVMFFSALVEGRVGPQLVGAYPMDVALRVLLSGSPLAFRELRDDVFEIYIDDRDPWGAEAAPETAVSARDKRRAPSASAPASRRGPPGATQAAYEQVVVTAQKRQELPQDIPVALSVLPGADIGRLDITSMQSLAQNVPSLYLGVLAGGESRLMMRGLTSGTGFAPVVGYYLDETSFDIRPTSWLGVPDIEMVDIDRVEVLRGPQGTLFGASAMGGAVRLISKRPDLTRTHLLMEAETSTTSGGGTGYGLRSVWNQPLGPRVAVRLVGSVRERAGYIDQALPANPLVPSAEDPIVRDDVNDVGTVLIRGAALWRPAEGVSVTPSLMYQRRHAEGLDSFQSAGSARFVRHHIRVDSSLNEDLVVGLKAEGAWRSLQLSWETSRLERKSDGLLDLAALGSVWSQEFGGNASEVYPTANHTFVRFRQFTQEVRAASDAISRLRWIAGLHYKHIASDVGQVISDPALGGFISASLGVWPATDRLVDSYIVGRSEEIAGFGEITLDLTSHLSASAGIRYYDLRQTNEPGWLSGLLGDGVVAYERSSHTGANPRLGLQYRFWGDSMVYASSGTGYRPGGYSWVLSKAGAECRFAALYRRLFDPDEVRSHELGAKMAFLDRRVSLNVAAYRTDWSRIQGRVSSDCGRFGANFGSARIDGVEAELQWRPLPRLLIGGSASYLNGRFATIAPGFTEALSIHPGDRITGVPRLQWSLSGQWSLPLGARMDAFVRAAWQYVGSAPTTFSAQGPTNTRAAYGNINLALGGNVRDTELSLFVRNAANQMQVVDINVSTAGEVFSVVASPRTIGVAVRHAFR